MALTPRVGMVSERLLLVGQPLSAHPHLDLTVGGATSIPFTITEAAARLIEWLARRSSYGDPVQFVAPIQRMLLRMPTEGESRGCQTLQRV
jgi:hypothetical protein